MKTMSIVKVALLVAAVALPARYSVAEAKTMTMPAGACAFGKKDMIENAKLCSFNCDPKTLWCQQQVCFNGSLATVLPCYGSLCTPKCGG